MNDDQEHKTYRAIVYGVTTGVCVLILSITGYCSNTNYLTEKAMEVEGNNPLEVGCALQNNTSMTVCGILASKETK